MYLCRPDRASTSFAFGKFGLVVGRSLLVNRHLAWAFEDRCCCCRRTYYHLLFLSFPGSFWSRMKLLIPMLRFSQKLNLAPLYSLTIVPCRSYPTRPTNYHFLHWFCSLLFFAYRFRRTTSRSRDWWDSARPQRRKWHGKYGSWIWRQRFDIRCKARRADEGTVLVSMDGC